MKYAFGIFLGICSQLASAADMWTDWRKIDDIYTYTRKDTLYVYLNGISCPNTKNYFTIDGTKQENANQLISMVLAAKLANKKINVYYDPSESTDYCYFKGLKIQD